MKGCTFCSKKQINRQGLLFEDRFCYVLLNEYPNTYGHTIVIPKRHFKDMLEATEGPICDMFNVANRVAKKIKKQLKPKGIKFVCNAAGLEEIEHMHVHVIPVYKKSHKSLLPGYLKNKEITEKERKDLVKLLKLANT